MKKEITIDIYANYLMITKPEKRKAKKIKILKRKSSKPLRSFVNINIIIKYIMLYYYSMMAFKTNFFCFK